MAGHGTDLITLLKAELRFIELGGYDPSRAKTWHPKSIFQDSLTCIYFGAADRGQNCKHCPLFEFVKLEHRSEETPCHFIPLTDSGKTISDLEGITSFTRLKGMVKDWLRWKIRQLELDQSRSINSAQLQGGLS